MTPHNNNNNNATGGVSGYWDATYGVHSLTYTTLQANGPSQVIVPPPKARVTLFPWVRASAD